MEKIQITAKKYEKIKKKKLKQYIEKVSKEVPHPGLVLNYATNMMLQFMSMTYDIKD